MYAEIPTIVVATTRSGNERVFAGCYVMRRSNVQDRGWHIYRAECVRCAVEHQTFTNTIAGLSQLNFRITKEEMHDAPKA